MSKYIGTRMYYNETSKSYNNYREPIGTDIIIGMITVYSNQTHKEIRILDTGCGPGSQAKSLIKYGFRHVTLLDESSAMLGQARKNLSEEIRDSYIEEIVEESLPVIPFPDNSFDVVLFSLVLHHVKNSANNGPFSAIVETLQEAHRILRPNGMIIITTVMSSAFHDEIAWFLQLIPRLNSIAASHFPSMSQWDSIFTESGFRCVSKIRVLGPEANGPFYKEVEGPLKEDWRNSFPYFIGATKDEIKEMESKVSAMKKNDTLEQWVNDADKSNEHGMYGILVCVAK